MKKIFTLLTLAFTFTTTMAQWSTLGSGLNAEATTLVFFNGDLYAGGNFTQAGDTAANYIARWDGSTWSPVGTGMNAAVRALCVYNNELYAGGDFNVAGGITARKIAKWNGVAWDSVGTGINDSGFVAALAVHDNELYVGGQITNAGDVQQVHGIARWNGSAWNAVGFGFTSMYFPKTIVKSLYSHNGTLYAAGMFDQAENDFAVGVAEWDGLIWSDLNFGFNNEGLCMTGYSGFLYVGGSFSETINGGQPMGGFGQWDGTSWEQIGTGVDSTVSAMAVFKNNLYVGGYFKTANNQAARHLAVWNGGTFDAVPLGTDTAILSMAADSSALYMAGLFTTAGGIAASHIVKYAGSTDIKEHRNAEIDVWPNPSNGSFLISLSKAFNDADVKVFDVVGNEVYFTKLNGTKATVDLSFCADGVYMLKVSEGSFELHTSRLILIR